MSEKRSSDVGTFNNDKPQKKQRLSFEPAEAEIFTREVAPDVALEIDLMILDYQAYQTTKHLIDSTYDSSSKASTRLQQHLDMMDSWIDYFAARYPSYHQDDRLDLRLALLRFSALYFRRLKHSKTTPPLASLLHIRNESNERAARWIGHIDRVPSARYDTDRADAFDETLPLPQSILQKHRQQNLTVMKVVQHSQHDGSHFYGSQECVSLLHLLSSFMHICAMALIKHHANPEKLVTQLLCSFIRQACLEQYLVYGAQGCDAIDQALAWGCFNEQPIAKTFDWTIDNMFRDATTSEELVAWTRSRDSVLDELMADSGKGESLQQKLERLAQEYPLEEFDASLREFTMDLFQSLEAPILVQLERGQLQDMSAEQTAVFLQDCGIDPSIFLSNRRHQMDTRMSQDNVVLANP